MSEPTEPPRWGLPPGSKNRVNPAPIPLPPRPAELTDDLVSQVNGLIDRRPGRGVVYEYLSMWLTWLVIASGETSTARTRATLLAWGIACEPRDVTAERLRAAITQAAGHTPTDLYQEIRAIIDDPVRQRLVNLLELYAASNVIDRYRTPNRYRGRCISAITATGLQIYVQRYNALVFATRNLAAVIRCAAFTSGVTTTISAQSVSQALGALDAVNVVRESGRAHRIVGEPDEIIQKLDKFSSKQLKLLGAEYRRFSAKTPNTGVVSA